VISGVDSNRDGLVWDLPPGVETLNSARGADFSQLDLRVSKDFHIGRRTQVQLIAEVFNVLNDKNPNVFVENMASATFGTPTRYAGDFRQASSGSRSSEFACSSSRPFAHRGEGAEAGPGFRSSSRLPSTRSAYTIR
jgi:hypothetical protein